MNGTTTWFAALTLAAPLSQQEGAGMQQISMTRLVEAGPDATMAELYEYLRGQAPEPFRSEGTVVFFHAAPNALGGAS